MKRVTCAIDWKKIVMLIALAGLVGIGAGCASAKVKVTSRNRKNLVEPDFVLVNEFDFAPKQVKTDRGIITRAVKDRSKKSLKERELAIGKSAAKALAAGIVENLRKAGVSAYTAGDGHKATDKTLIISGKFIRIDQGNRTVRVLVGFGLGSGDIKALVECTQGGRLIAKGIVTTSGSMKPGMAVPFAGAAAGGAQAMAVSSAVGGAAAGGSELLLTTVEADANRAANKIAVKIVQGYINHDWLPKDAVNRINGFF